jgi:hypothetical protein
MAFGALSHQAPVTNDPTTKIIHSRQQMLRGYPNNFFFLFASSYVMAPVRRTARNLTIHMVFFYFLFERFSSFADGEARSLVSIATTLLKANER